MKKTIGLLGAAGLFVSVAFAQSHRASKAQDEQALRNMESETAGFERQNDPSKMGALADDWICLVNFNRKTLWKAEFQENLKNHLAAHGKGPNPYTVEKKNMRVDWFGDTAVVTYIKEYRQTEDAPKSFAEDDTDVFTRSSEGWRLRLTKIARAPRRPHPTDNTSRFLPAVA